MLDYNRLDERLWLLNEVQQFAYHDSDSGGIAEFSSWCEIEYNRILSKNPVDVRALAGECNCPQYLTMSWDGGLIYHPSALGQIWLSKSQYWLARVFNEDRSDDDDEEAECRRFTPDYVEARAALIPAVDFFARAAVAASQQTRLTGELLALVSKCLLISTSH